MGSGSRWGAKPPWIGWMPRYARKVVAARGVEAEEQSEVVGKFGGPWRGRTCGALIKSDKRPFLIKLAIATVPPDSIAIPMFWSLLLFFYVIPFYPFHSGFVGSHHVQDEGGDLCLFSSADLTPPSYPTIRHPL